MGDNAVTAESDTFRIFDATGIERSQQNPTKFQLSQNYPNPFNPSTTISYAIPRTSHVEVSIFNLAGQKITTLVKDALSPGNYTITWDASNYSSGIYIYQIKADDFIRSKKMLLIK